MTPRERVLAQLEHHETDFVPYARLGFEGDVADRLDAYYGGPAWRDKVCNHIRQVPGLYDGMDFGEGPRFRDPFGTLWRTDLRPFHLEEPGLDEPDLDGYPFPSAKDLFRKEWQQLALDEIEQNQDTFLVVGFGFGLFERTWAIRGFENVLTDSIAQPEFYAALVERVAALQMDMIAGLVELPVDGIMFSDDWGGQRGVLLGPQGWRKYMKPHLAKMYEMVHKAGKWTLSHCCGNVKDVVPDLIEIGLDCLQSVQPEAMDPYELKRLYGSHITFWGGLGSQRTVPFGSPGEIRAEVRRLCEEMGRGCGYILGPAKALQPETPTENAVAVVEAFIEQTGQAIH